MTLLTKRHDPQHQAPERWHTFSSLRIRNYRLFFIGQLVSMTGTWMQTVAQSFLVLHLTNSGTALGLTTAARFGPMFVFGPWGGLVADRLDKRRVLYVTQSLAGLLALVFGLLISAHAMTMPILYVLSALLGFVNVFDNPARQAFIAELVPAAELANAVTLNSVTMNLARIFGAALGGASVAAVGFAPSFDINAASFVAVLITLAMMVRPAGEISPREPRQPGQVRDGLRYVRETPELLVPLLMVAVVGTLAWEFQVSLPLIARDSFHGGAATYGTMASLMGVGAVVGGLVSASRSKRRVENLAFASIGWGAAITAAAVAPTLGFEYVALLFVGYGSITFNTQAKTALQLASAPEMRGRVMALWALAWLGSTPIGGPIVGFVATELGARWGLLIGGLPTMVMGAACYPALKRIGRRSVEMAAPRLAPSNP